jgi:hypothetical protein
MGFTCKELDQRNKMFFMMEFVKSGTAAKAGAGAAFSAKASDTQVALIDGKRGVLSFVTSFAGQACVYKKR